MKFARAWSLLLLVTPALFRESAAQDKKKKPADPKTWMSLRGPLLWEELYANGAYAKEWSLYKGKYIVERTSSRSPRSRATVISPR